MICIEDFTLMDLMICPNFYPMLKGSSVSPYENCYPSPEFKIYLL